MLIHLRPAIVLSAALLTASAAAAAAQSPARTFDELDSTLKLGQKVAVKDLDGDTISGLAVSVTF